MTIEQALNQPKIFTRLAYGGLALMLLGGFIIAGSELSAASQTVFSEQSISNLDTYTARDVWDRLPLESEVFDSIPWRATMLTGRLTRVVIGNMSYNYGRSLVWEALRANPSVERFLENGYRYIYIDKTWWDGLSTTARASLSAPCVQAVTEHVDNEKGDFRRLVDLDKCEP